MPALHSKPYSPHPHPTPPTPAFLRPNRPQRQLDDALRQCQSGGGGGGAKWGVCALLFSSKAETSALYKSLAYRYLGKVAFVEVQGSDKVRPGKNGTDLNSFRVLA